MKIMFLWPIFFFFFFTRPQEYRTVRLIKYIGDDGIFEKRFFFFPFYYTTTIDKKLKTIREIRTRLRDVAIGGPSIRIAAICRHSCF